MTPPTTDEQPYTRDRLSLIALLFMAGAGIALCFLVAGPFIPGITWALAFAVVANPVHQWVSRHIAKPDLAAAVSVVLLALLLVIPTVFVVWQVGGELSANADRFEQFQNGEEWKQKLQEAPRVAAIVDWLSQQVDLKAETQGFKKELQDRAARTVRSLVWGLVQLFIALFALFYFLRDKTQVLRKLRSLLPFSEREGDDFLSRIAAITHATVYGTLVVSFVQGALGGLMFFFLAVPGALLWGVVMGLFSIVPMLGAFVVWMPAALWLAAQGSWGKAIILTVWGTVVVGLIDNLLYPMLVGKEMRLHTLPVFIAVVGGLILFGAAGLVLGPVILGATIAMIDILKRRTVGGRSAAEPT